MPQGVREAGLVSCKEQKPLNETDLAVIGRDVDPAGIYSSKSVAADCSAAALPVGSGRRTAGVAVRLSARDVTAQVSTTSR